MAKLVLRRDQLAKLRRWKGIDTDTQLAEALRMHPGQVSRVLSGKSAPGPRFIAGCLEIWGIDSFADLFAVVPDNDGNGEAA